MKNTKLTLFVFFWTNLATAFQSYYPYSSTQTSRNPERIRNTFLIAAQEGDIKTVKKHLPFSSERLFFMIDPNVQTVESINVQDPESGMTALFLASQNGHWEIVDLLLQRGANSTITNNDGVTPLLIATLNDHGNVITTFLRHGINPNTKNKKIGEPLLTIAAALGKARVTKALLDRGANPDIQASDGSTPILQALLRDHGNIITIFLQHGTNPDTKDTKLGEPLLTIAVEQNKAHAVDALNE